MELNFDKLFKIPTTALKINRLHPYIKRDKTWLLQTTPMFGMVASALCIFSYNIIYHDLKTSNFSRTCKNSTLVIVYLLNTVQFLVLIIHQDSLLKLIKDMKKDYEISKSLPFVEQMIVKNYANKGLYVCNKQWLTISIMSFAAFLLKNIFLHLYYYWIDEYRLVPFYDLIYPQIIEDKKDTILVYLVLYVHLNTCSLYSVTMYSAYVALGPIMMLHACGQLEIAKMRIDHLFVELDDKVINEKLKIITEQLQYIYSFVQRVTDVFKIAYELTLSGTTLILPVTFYEVIEAAKHGELSIEFITFIVGGILISSSPCYYSDLLKEKGENVRLSLYSCGWERHNDRRARTTLQILLLYAQRPVAIKTLFRTLCLDELTDLFQQSYKIFSLINAMWE